jgi:ankyrin repeat protein
MSGAGVEAFFAACRAGALPALRLLLAADPALARARYEGTTGLHLAVGHPGAVGLLLEHGADPNARDEGDNALPLHFAAGGAPLESVRLLLDAGSDVQGEGDAHRLDVIGWATVFSVPRREVADLLESRGARHHVFSAIALGDVELLRRVVAADPASLARRLSPTEQEQTALHYVVAPPDGLVGGLFRTGAHYATLDALIELGADLEARDTKGRTPLAIAMLRGDRDAMRRLHAAGARAPELAADADPSPGTLRSSIGKLRPMVGVPDLEGTLAWYRAVGFEVMGTHEADGRLDWAAVSFGGAELMFVPTTDAWRARTEGVSFWIDTDRLDDLYRVLKHRQLERARAALVGEPVRVPDVRFTADLYTTHYGQRGFGIRDPNGVELIFSQPV